MDIRCVSTGTITRRSLPGVAFECLPCYEREPDSRTEKYDATNMQ